MEIPKLKKEPEKEDTKKTEQEKVEERREEVLARGRKFKYPLQYAKHRLMINTIIISVVVVAALVFSGWLALFKFHATGDVIYRITTVLPVSVAEVDGEKVRFSDYLMIYRSAISAVEQQIEQLGTDTNLKDLETQYQQMALASAEEYAYALKLAREQGIEVTDEEVAESFVEHRKVGGVERSEESFLKILSDNFNLSKSEYERMIYLSLVKMKVEQFIDENANSIVSQVETMLQSNGSNYAAVKTALGDAVEYEETGGLVDSKNVDGGRANKAIMLEAGADSGKFLSSNGDGYYFVKLLSKDSTQVNYVSIKVPFSEFNNRMDKIREEGLVKEYIKFEEPEPEETTESEQGASVEE